MSEILSPNELTLDEHVERIRKAMLNARDAIVDVAVAIGDFNRQFGENLQKKEVAALLGMSESTFNRWVSIADSEFILQHRKDVPPTFTGLYYISQLEGKYQDFYGSQVEARKNLRRLVETGRLNINCQNSDVQDFLREIKYKINKRKKTGREQDFLQLGSKQVSKEEGLRDIFDLVEKGEVFRSFLIDLTGARMKGWSDSGSFESDMRMDFPLHELRSPSQSEAVVCLLLVPMNKIHVGLKVLSAYGFTYRDAFTPNVSGHGLTLLDKQTIVLRGERGAGSQVGAREIQDPKPKTLAEYIEQNFEAPYLCAFSDLKRDGWTCVN